MPKLLKKGQSVAEIDAGLKNKWLWRWLDENDLCGVQIGKWCSKTDSRGTAYCHCCDKYIQYGQDGKTGIKSHSQTQRDGKNPHMEAYITAKGNQKMPGWEEDPDKLPLIDRYVGIITLFIRSRFDTGLFFSLLLI